jgi:hypothetical protein
MTNTLVAAITNGRTESTLTFCSMLLKLQGATGASSPHAKFIINYFVNVNDAFAYFLKDPSLDVIVCIDTWKACDPRFILDPPPEDMPFVVGVYPLPGVIDWDRVKTTFATQHASTEPSQYVGNRYSAVLRDGCQQSEGKRYVPVQSTELGVFAMRRCVLDEIVATHGRSVLGSDGNGVCIASDGMWNDPDEGKVVVLPWNKRVCALWGKDVYADLDATCTSFGPVGYTGCVGLRKTLR